MSISFDKYAISKWLIENTCLTFNQISIFSKIPLRDIQLIADDSPRYSAVLPINPINSNLLTEKEIKKGEADINYIPEIINMTPDFIQNQLASRKKYIPKVYNKYKPSCILWFLTNEETKYLSDSIIIKLLKTTKGMINNIKNKTYKNYNSLRPQNPITIGFFDFFELKQEIDQYNFKKNKNKNK